MMELVIQFVVCIFATLSFAVLFFAPKRELVFCGVTGALGWVVYLVCIDADMAKPIANLIATLVLTLLSRTIAAVRRVPVTVYLICGIFPLVPGAGIYYTSYYFIMGEFELFSDAGTNTLKAAVSIVLGIMFGFALPQRWFNKLGQLFHKQDSTPTPLKE
jgi:uncharacterized membrane protein YjjB (DUF3815 family)